MLKSGFNYSIHSVGGCTCWVIIKVGRERRFLLKKLF